MERTLGILLSTAAIGLGVAAGAAPAAANPAIVLPLAAAAGGLAIGGAAVSTYPYDYQESYGYNGRTAVAPPAGYPTYAFPQTTIYPQATYTYADTAAPTVIIYQPMYASACNVVSQRESNGWSAEWRNYTICH